MSKNEVIVNKLQELEIIKLVLKKEFVGIDVQIDQIINSLKTWYIFPESLNRPLIINLWGITGTFKTSVIRRIVSLLDMDNRFKEVDARTIPGKDFLDILGIQSANLLSKTESIDEIPNVILVDEFQNIRTIDRYGDTTKQANELHELFSLLSDGKIKYARSVFMLGKVRRIAKSLVTDPKLMIVRINERMEHKAEEEARRNEYKLKGTNGKKFASLNDSVDENGESIDEMVGAEYSKAQAFWDLNYYELEQFSEFNYSEIIQFGNDVNKLFAYIIEVAGTINPDITLDLSKSVIFIAGNLDNIFSGLTHSLDTDSISPDEFYAYTTQVNFNDVKNCLLESFKPEQVSRLGTNHVIFPSFNNRMYKRLIKNLHKRTLAKFKFQPVKITIDPSVDAFLLKHGALPSQGARSILSSHEFVVDSNISESIALAILNRSKEVTLRIENNMLQLVTKKVKVNKDISIVDTRVLENYPEPLNSVIAVHEGAHALAVIALTGRYPDMIKVRSSDQNVGGYVKYSPSEGIANKREMLNSLAITMAGYAGEYLIHGPDNVSSGAGSDILNATSNASAMIKLLGLGDRLSAAGFSMSRDGLVLNETDLIAEQVDDLISEAFTLAVTVLEFYKEEHLMLTEALKTRVTMRDKDIKKLLKM